MPREYPESDKEVISALFIDDPRRFLDLLEIIALAQEESEPEFAKTWNKLAKTLAKAGSDLGPLYRKPK